MNYNMNIRNFKHKLTQKGVYPRFKTKRKTGFDAGIISEPAKKTAEGMIEGDDSGMSRKESESSGEIGGSDESGEVINPNMEGGETGEEVGGEIVGEIGGEIGGEIDIERFKKKFGIFEKKKVED